MTRNNLRQVMAMLLVALVAAAPVTGSVCTMSCSDAGGACCCEGGGSMGVLELSAESCCADVVSSPAASNLTAERLTGSSSAGSVVASILFAAPENNGPVHPGQALLTLPPEQRGGRSSPLFLLNASFLI